MQFSVNLKRKLLLNCLSNIIWNANLTLCVLRKFFDVVMVTEVVYCTLPKFVGIGNCLAPMFLTEMSPFNLRGAFGTINQLSVTIGIFVSSVCGLPALLG